MYKKIIFVVMVLITLSSVNSVGWHIPDEIVGGTFSNNYIFTGTLNFTNANLIGIGGAGFDADTLDGVDSASFLRSDVADTINVGRGDVYIENNANDNVDGAGITLRTSSNPTSGSIFSVRSSGGGLRLWVGQSMTGTSNTDLRVGIGSDGTGGYAVWHKNNDGSGSGLSADNLDGYDITHIVRKNGDNNGWTSINAQDNDFIVEDGTDSVTNFIWRDHSANRLYLGTPNAQVIFRSDWVKLPVHSSPPVACSSAYEGAMYYDTNGEEFACVCTVTGGSWNWRAMDNKNDNCAT